MNNKIEIENLIFTDNILMISVTGISNIRYFKLKEKLYVPFKYKIFHTGEFMVIELDLKKDSISLYEIKSLIENIKINNKQLNYTPVNYNLSTIELKELKKNIGSSHSNLIQCLNRLK